MSERKETGLLFKPEMVRAVLDDRKTQTRRLRGLESVNSYPGTFVGEASGFGPLGYRGLAENDYWIRDKKAYAANPTHFHWFLGRSGEHEVNPIPVKCPYGGVGDLIWGRETFLADPPDDGTWCFADWTDGVLRHHDAIPERFQKREHVIYCEGWTGPALRWSPSIFMPRWGSRILLEITGLRAERLQSISFYEIRAEGIGCPAHDFDSGFCSSECAELRKTWANGWDGINGKRPGCRYADNPWVWVIEFKKTEASK